MQKKLIALAIAGLSGAAFAQSNVTIYGIADMSFDSVSATGATAAGTDLGSRARVSSTSSYIGFKGSEALGNGMTAVFQIENGLQLDNAAGGVWNNRDSYVGLSGGFGTVVLGNVTGPTRALGAKFDVNAGATGIGANTALLGKGVAQTAGASPFDQRITNAIAYITPNLNGFTGTLGYSTGLTVAGQAFAAKETSAAGANVKGNTATTLGLSYENGPIYVGYAYTVVNTTNSGATAADGLGVSFGLQKAQDNRLGVMYNFGQGTVGLLWDQPKYTTNGNVGWGALANTALKNSVWYLPVTYTIGSGKIIAQYGRANDVTSMSGTNSKHFVLGYEYSLSKRTMLKAVYSSITNATNASNDFLYGVSQANSTATASGVSAGADPRGVSFGLRHAF